MKKCIHDIFDGYIDKDTPISSQDGVSAQRVTELVKQKIKEDDTMTVRKRKFTTPLITAAAIAALSFSAIAASSYLSARDVALHVGENKLAECVDTSYSFAPQTSGDYTFSILGTASGKSLSSFTENADKDETYIVGMVTRTDGGKLSDYPGIMLTPLVEGYKPWEVNAFTIGGGRSEFISEDGYADYFIFQCSNLEIFADKTVYIAMYELEDANGAGAPSAEIFAVNEDGTIRYADGFNKARALFELPMDKSKADPAAVEKLLDGRESVIDKINVKSDTDAETGEDEVRAITIK